MLWAGNMITLSQSQARTGSETGTRTGPGPRIGTRTKTNARNLDWD